MQVYLLLTEKCNLNCKMCIRGEKNECELSLSDIKDSGVTDELRGNDIVITGGEPSLCRDFTLIASYLSTVANSVSICTNGIKNDYITKDFFCTNIKLQISIDGIEDYHDNIRGLGTYSCSFSTISKLEKLEIPYSIATVVNKNNAACMIKLAGELAKLKSMQHWSVSYEMPFGSASFEDMMSVDEWNGFVDELLDYVEFKMKIRKLFSFDLFIKYKDKLDSLLSGKMCYNCGSGRDKIYIYPDLTIYSCTCLTDFPLGNLKNESLTDILANNKTKLFSEYKVVVDSECYNCDFLKYCNGGCIGMSYHYFGKLGYGDIRCPKLTNQKTLRE